MGIYDRDYWKDRYNKRTDYTERTGYRKPLGGRQWLEQDNPYGNSPLNRPAIRRSATRSRPAIPAEPSKLKITAITLFVLFLLWRAFEYILAR